MSNRRSNLRFLKIGLPFFSFVGGSVVALRLVQDIRYEFRKQKHQKSVFEDLVIKNFFE